MKISLSNAGKRFNRDWIFRKLDFEFLSGSSYAIIGSNGSGKSTLLQAIAGAILLNEGKINYSLNNQPVTTDNIYRSVAFCAPYLDLIEEMTLEEFLSFHARFKPFLPNLPISAVMEEIGLTHAKNKQIRFFSSGMRQRVKLGQSILANNPILLLDEPCTNLDKEGIARYHHLVQTFASHKLIIVGSNDEVEFSFCKEQLNIMQYKS